MRAKVRAAAAPGARSAAPIREGPQCSTSLAASLCCSPWQACRGAWCPWQGRVARSAGRHAPCLAASLPRLLARRVCSGNGLRSQHPRALPLLAAPARRLRSRRLVLIIEQCYLKHATVLTPASTLCYHSWFHPQWRKKRMRRLKPKRRRQRAK